MTQPPQWGQQPGGQPQPGYPQQGYPQQGYPQQGQWQPGQWQGQPGGYPPGQPPQPYPGQPGGYPAQPGHPVHPQAGAPQPGAPQVLPGRANRPGVATAAMVLSYVIAAGMTGLGLYILGSGIAGDGSLIVMIPIAAIVGGLGLLNLVGAYSLNHRDFPHFQQAQAGTMMPLLICIGGAIRSLSRGVDLVDSFSIGVLVLLAVCVTVLVLLSRPVVREWVRVTHEDSIRRGVVPRNGPRTMGPAR
ncbi:hypothetical protein JOF53_005375 [Crossiella equi]|uniref:Uncharacterized protein n=1 Tax=Crossiella equi TaxID=130796 RepID=A0ABS5AIW2_9PSEU|nr:hypothetical protein [Crossiella equi]MBP2476503.1 hypothetical protein [Crossiella equi]